MSEPDSPKQSETDPLPRENPFKSIWQLTKSSAGRLPGHLVVLFIIALAIALICGVALKFSENQIVSRDLPLRLKPDEKKPALSQAALRGVWVAQKNTSVLTLRIGGDRFELVARINGTPYTRYFLRGSYRIEGNILILQQRKEMGTPFDPSNLQVEYYPLNLQNINIDAGFSPTGMAWAIPAPEMRRLSSRDVITRSVFAPEMSWIKISSQP